MADVNLIWSTPDGESLLAYMARVSNINAKPDDPSTRLIKYLIDHQHWSPFEMVNVCVKIDAPRDIVRQILRHRSFTFQEFSGRYAEYDGLLERREARGADPRSRQSSIPVSVELSEWWDNAAKNHRDAVWEIYTDSLARGMAKEVARTLLPEGFVPSVIYMNGSLRSWIHYVNIRTGPETQREHRDVAFAIKEIIKQQYPTVTEALQW